MAPKSSPEIGGNHDCVDVDVCPLFLVGTVHRDPAGGGKLRRLLTEIAPNILTLEMSSLAARYRRDHGRVLLVRLERILDRLADELGRDRNEIASQPAVAEIRALLAYPFEYETAAVYAQEKGIPLSLIDLPDVSAIKLRRVEKELITYRNIKILLDVDRKPQTSGVEGYAQAATLLSGSGRIEIRQAFLDRRRGREGVGPRDRAMADEIRKRIALSPSARLVHIGGWVHLLDDERKETLYSLLEDMNPSRMLLQ